MSEENFGENGGGQNLDMKKQKKAEWINNLEPTGNLLDDIEALANIVGSSLERYFTDPITDEEKVDITNPDAVYQFYTSPESQEKLNKTYENPVHAAHVEAIKRILKAFKERPNS